MYSDKVKEIKCFQKILLLNIFSRIFSQDIFLLRLTSHFLIVAMAMNATGNIITF